ncbi:MAG: amidase [Bacilli bacterium]|nr:amidase [Bacilli bacterium]
MTLYLERIDAYNEQYNAIISINEDALDMARECDILYQENGRTSLLFGIPIIIKDNIDYTVLPTTGGSLALADSYPLTNATIVQNLLDAGAIIIGKSNMSEFPFSANSSLSSYGHVKNAYDLEYTPYGSSGGSAVSVAASLAPLAIGTDTNSSVRLPASANNIVGLRPTYGLLSIDGIITYDKERDTAGTMSKTVADNAILLTILASNGIDYTTYLDEDGLSDKSIGVLTQFIKEVDGVYPISSYYDEIEDFMNEAIAIMGEKGATIVYIADFYNSYYSNINNQTLMGALFCYEFNQYIVNTTSSIKSYGDLLASGGFIQNLEYYNYSCDTDLRLTELEDINVMKNEYRTYVEDIMEEYEVDVLVYPSFKGKLLKLSEIYTEKSGNVTATIAPTTGFPAITVPLGFDSDDLPYGIEFLALSNREDLLYKIAYSYEQASNNRVSPTIAPSLYEVSNDLQKLVSYYVNGDIDSNLYTTDSYNNYYNIYVEIGEFISNYDEEEDEEITNLLATYEETYNNLEEDENSGWQKYIIILDIIVFVLLAKIIIFIRKRNNRLRHKKRVQKMMHVKRY